MSQHKKELPICVISVGRNINRKDIYKKYIDSLARQNYTNFKVFYVDDVSDDQTV